MKQLTEFSTRFYSRYKPTLDAQQNRLLDARIAPSVSVTCHFVDGPFVEIHNTENYDLDHPATPVFIVNFLDNRSGDLVYQTEIKPGMWSRCAIRYYLPWKIEVLSKDSGDLVFEHTLDLKGQRVAITMESKSLGDNLAWVPAIKDFKDTHGCEVVAVTYINQHVQRGYPDITFVEPGKPLENLYALYRIGWFSKNEGKAIEFNMNPVDYRKKPLQATAYHILGLPYDRDQHEKTPVLVFSRSRKGKKPLTTKPYFTMATMSTCQAKFWNRAGGWDTVVAYLNSRGYDVVHLSREEDGYMGNARPKGVIQMPASPLEEVMSVIHESEGFIGIGSGLSWLAWALQKPVVLVSGFSEEYTEMKRNTIRVAQTNPLVCSGCFNTEYFDRGNWNWCPMHEGTSRQFECTKTIDPQTVIDAIESIM